MSPKTAGGRKSVAAMEGSMAAVQRTLAVCALAVIGVVGAGPASAAPPQRIYSDIADNGRLDGRYTRADIERALSLEQNVRSDARPPTVRRPSSASRSDSGSGNALPFTGIDLALLAVGGGPLVLIGLRFRRRLAEADSARVGMVRS